MENKYLWIVVPRRKDGEPFPLFWNSEPPAFENVEDIGENLRDKIIYLFSDSDKDYTDGYVISWSNLNLLDDKSVLPKL